MSKTMIRLIAVLTITWSFDLVAGVSTCNQSSILLGSCRPHLTSCPELASNAGTGTVWQLRVYTGKFPEAGTNAMIGVQLFGTSGSTRPIILTDPKGVNFQPGKDTVFQFTASEFGEPTKLRAWHDNKGTDSSWYVEKFELLDIPPTICYTFEAQRWLSTNKGFGEIVREFPATGLTITNPFTAVNISVSILTAVKDDLAGTNAEVYIILNTEDGSGTGKRPLRITTTPERNPWEKANTDTSVIEAVLTSSVISNTLGHDNTGGGPGWLVEEVKISLPGFNHIFPIMRWLSKTDDGGLIERTIDLKQHGWRQ